MAHVRTRVPGTRRTFAVLATATVALVGLSGCFLHPSAQSANGSFVAGASVASQPASPRSLGFDPLTVVSSAVPSAVKAYISAHGGHSAIEVADRATGAALAINGDKTFQTASIVKFDILATRLYQHQQAGTTMSAHEKSLAFKMITASDNNAASALFAMDGSAKGLTTANKVFGMEATHVASAWGLTHTTPTDQIRLMSTVMDPNGPINATNQTYILTLMSQVEPDQRWGVPAAAIPDSTNVYVKNGWDTMTAYGGLWGDNSIGRIVEPGHDWLVAVMSNYNRTDSAGHHLDGELATLAVGGLRLQAQLAGAR
ncbi:MAG TPA: serine hydrolase [Micromonosporaceae bacterium]|nr:serine hydrolase [Micromonosporaceae bacterium]